MAGIYRLCAWYIPVMCLCLYVPVRISHFHLLYLGCVNYTTSSAQSETLLTSYFSVVISQNCNISAVQCVKHAHLLHLDDYRTYFSDVCIIATRIRNLPTMYCSTGKEFAIYTIL